MITLVWFPLETDGLQTGMEVEVGFVDLFTDNEALIDHLDDEWDRRYADDHPEVVADEDG